MEKKIREVLKNFGLKGEKAEKLRRELLRLFEREVDRAVYRTLVVKGSLRTKCRW